MTGMKILTAICGRKRWRY